MDLAQFFDEVNHDILVSIMSNIYVTGRRAGERVLSSITRFVEDCLRLKVNHVKNAIARPWDRKLLGYSFTAHKQCKVRVAAKSKRFRKHLKELFRMGRGRIPETVHLEGFESGNSRLD
jgi:hypothetical protein